MADIVWSDDLSVGIEVIDDQHKALLQRLNDVSKAAEIQQGESEVTKSLSFLSEYADHHFSAEEKHMEATGYPGLEEQKAKHKEFMDTLADLEKDFIEEGANRPLADAINVFLLNWLTNHIKGMDKNFGTYLADKGISITG